MPICVHVCVCKHFKIELKDVNLKLVVYLICPGSVNKHLFLKTKNKIVKMVNLKKRKQKPVCSPVELFD